MVVDSGLVGHFRPPVRPGSYRNRCPSFCPNLSHLLVSLVLSREEGCSLFQFPRLAASVCASGRGWVSFSWSCCFWYPSVDYQGFQLLVMKILYSWLPSQDLRQLNYSWTLAWKSQWHPRAPFTNVNNQHLKLLFNLLMEKQTQPSPFGFVLYAIIK